MYGTHVDTDSGQSDFRAALSQSLETPLFVVHFIPPPITQHDTKSILFFPADGEHTHGDKKRNEIPVSRLSAAADEPSWAVVVYSDALGLRATPARQEEKWVSGVASWGTLLRYAATVS